MRTQTIPGIVGTIPSVRDRAEERGPPLGPLDTLWGAAPRTLTPRCRRCGCARLGTCGTNGCCGAGRHWI